MKKFFFNYLTFEYEEECAHEINGRWFIKVGFAGANTDQNNRDGYANRVKAEYTCLGYQLSQ
jgi:hypothetical protein